MDKISLSHHLLILIILEDFLIIKATSGTKEIAKWLKAHSIKAKVAKPQETLIQLTKKYHSSQIRPIEELLV